MKKTGFAVCIILLVGMTGATLFQQAFAQEESYHLAYQDVFGSLRRPPIVFNHTGHEEALEEQGCAACHHAPDAESGKLVYIEDEEISCAECHGAEVQDGVRALREAFHASCTACHRQMKNQQKTFKGPTTCGECHRPNSKKTP